eukprot:TRINITY_DN61700_c0_g1_i1.p1 TRINITY_DN61700_c0_g1~~TRINITY_DN61700_c0_g1_i1.p1  ORF type:complete len:295 (+),score=72.97 TRINITY_DN61700_c0_g1_i1:90-887(+)
MSAAHDPRGISMFPQLLGVSQFLEKHPAVTDVQFFHRTGATKAAIGKWEARNHPYQLPEDLKSFLGISDGLLLRWGISLGRTTVPSLGTMYINSLPAITRVKDEGAETPWANQGKVCFVLDASPSTYGRVCLCYPEGSTTAPEVWFESLDCTWHFIAHTFTDYFRLLIMHLGLPAWCHTFTDSGLPPVTAEWFAFLSPERYQIDLQRGLQRPEAKEPPVISLSSIAGHLDPKARGDAAKEEPQRKEKDKADAPKRERKGSARRQD